MSTPALPGNPYSGKAAYPNPEQAKYEATMALAYEQRTANLISVTETLAVRMNLNEEDLLGRIVPEIRTRLGLDEVQA